MRSKLFPIAGGLAALAVYAGILIGGDAAIRNRDSAATPDFVLETPDDAVVEVPAAEAHPADTDAPAPARAPAPAPDPHPPFGSEAKSDKGSRMAARPIEPGLIAQPDDGVAKPLERIAPRPPFSKEPEKEEPATAVFPRPVALAAGLVRSGETTLQLKDIKPEKAEKVCEANGKSWPCGMVARTAFRNFLRGRALVCDGADGSAETVNARCSVGGRDVAEWLVSNGWATPLSGTPLEAKAEAARSARLGFFGDDPRDLAREPIALDDPTAILTQEDAAPDL
ncbi:thermonuclease family protein [Sinorhizobium medicae]|uniref:thermonuclease family protein n=1 Tax=Sinorhizobium medicae TaxID=110321 RepID=UPI000C7DB958|nr:thermonuclease family protein [Sinorhizobium medicae]MDX0450855.1 thermonuclease family protein [Sinorhizobium medicae]MDX0552866.1 thermonuclease family protein [Sinorhizobium medicae]MDX0567627.1 thermonuclease family protein [Sinorhizobium medicae]MDX0580292.1 thermonuclease family protein [Sinorhizobium medicae]MDX0701004.1 thermonuclease family protein [Sinorhizobium medicae]